MLDKGHELGLVSFARRVRNQGLYSAASFPIRLNAANPDCMVSAALFPDSGRCLGRAFRLSQAPAALPQYAGGAKAYWQRA